MQSIVVRLVVRQPHIRDRQQRVNRCRRRIERRIEASVQPRSLKRLEKFSRPLPEEQRLAAGERHAAARPVVERLVLKCLGDNRVNRHLLAVELQRPCRAGRLVHGAALVAHAQVPETRPLGAGVYRLGVVAPYAFQRTAFDEERCPYPRPVPDGHSLGIQHERRLHVTTPS